MDKRNEKQYSVKNVPKREIYLCNILVAFLIVVIPVYAVGFVVYNCYYPA